MHHLHKPRFHNFAIVHIPFLNKRSYLFYCTLLRKVTGYVATLSRIETVRNISLSNISQQQHRSLDLLLFNEPKLKISHFLAVYNSVLGKFLKSRKRALCTNYTTIRYTNLWTNVALRFKDIAVANLAAVYSGAHL